LSLDRSPASAGLTGDALDGYFATLKATPEATRFSIRAELRTRH